MKTAETPALNLSTLAKHFSDEGEAWALVERLRWPAGPVCPHCGEVGRAYFLKPRSGERTTAKGSVSYRRWWKCAACRKQFSVLVGTIFENTKVALSKWLLAVFMMTASKNGVAANELRRTLGVTQATAWFMNHRIRLAMAREPLAGMLSGTVVSDETWIGGKPRNRHQQGRPRPGSGRGLAGTPKDKAAVLSLVHKESGEVRSQVVANVDGPTLRKAIAEQVDMANTHLHTDGGRWYRPIASEFASHQWVDHDRREYVRGSVSTNQAENFFSQLKRSLDGTHHAVSKEHLHRYLAEFDYRYSTRMATDSQRMEGLMLRTGGRRLTYRGSKVETRPALRLVAEKKS